MIPRAHITAWRANAPWSRDAQVEQDLVLSRALVEIFSDPLLNSQQLFPRWDAASCERIRCTIGPWPMHSTSRSGL